MIVDADRPEGHVKTTTNETERPARILLLVSAIGLTPIALSYGILPREWVPVLFGFSADAVDARHIFRALMGLYLGMVALWVWGFLRPAATRAGLMSLMVFMYGLAAGRLLSFALDGLPTPLLIVYFALETTIGVIANLLLRRTART